MISSYQVPQVKLPAQAKLIFAIDDTKMVHLPTRKSSFPTRCQSAVVPFIYVHMLRFNFILGSIFSYLCFILIIIHYHTQKQRKIKIEPRIKLNHHTHTKLMFLWKIYNLWFFMWTRNKSKKLLFNIRNNKFSTQDWLNSTAAPRIIVLAKS